MNKLKYFLIFVTAFLVGCTYEEAAAIADTIDGAADAASDAGVPFAGPLSFITGAASAWLHAKAKERDFQEQMGAIALTVDKKLDAQTPEEKKRSKEELDKLLVSIAGEKRAEKARKLLKKTKEKARKLIKKREKKAMKAVA